MMAVVALVCHVETLYEGWNILGVDHPGNESPTVWVFDGDIVGYLLGSLFKVDKLFTLQPYDKTTTAGRAPK